MDTPPVSPSPFNIQNPPSASLLGDARRIDVRPRSGSKADEHNADTESSDEVLRFTCPACLHMLGTARQSATNTVRCPECAATVMPPQVVNAGGGKTALPPPRKSGTHLMRKR